MCELSIVEHNHVHCLSVSRESAGRDSTRVEICLARPARSARVQRGAFSQTSFAQCTWHSVSVGPASASHATYGHTHSRQPAPPCPPRHVLHVPNYALARPIIVVHRAQTSDLTLRPASLTTFYIHSPTSICRVGGAHVVPALDPPPERGSQAIRHPLRSTGPLVVTSTSLSFLMQSRDGCEPYM
jgi:hypothetical protein